MGLEIAFSGELVEWRGPAPYHFVPLPPDEADLVDEVKAEVAYWGRCPDCLAQSRASTRPGAATSPTSREGSSRQTHRRSRRSNRG